MLFQQLASFFFQLEKTASRNQMTEILAKLFKSCPPEEIDKVCYLCRGQLAPKYEGIEFNMAEKMVIRSIARSLKGDEKKVTKEFKKTGDLGDLFYNLKPKTKKSKLTVTAVYQKLLEIAQDSGEGSVERKIKETTQLLDSLDSLSGKYIVRMPVNKLRLGFSDMTILDALSWMKKGDKSLRKDLEKAFNVLADIGKIARIFKGKGINGIKKIKSEIGTPIRAALAERLTEPSKILEKMDGKCALEPKYDGFRCQIHIDKTKKMSLKKDTNLNLFQGKKQFFVRIFSRNLENTTHMFPDIVEAAYKLKIKNAILDGEAIAYNPKTGDFLPFQETVQRKRKHGIGKKIKELPLKVFVFDLLFLNNQALLLDSFKNRRKLLEEVLNKSKGEEKGIILTEQKIVSKAKDFDVFFKQVVGEGLEGLMAKKINAVYQAGSRNYNWVKYKAGMKSELADTIDCIVMGYYRGKGKRASFGIGAFLVGIISKNQILSVSKIGTGLTDEQWREMYERCEKIKIKDQPKEYKIDKNLRPDIWCKPELVVEIEADTITKSPIHTAGLALRFPRLKRFRDDKKSQESISLKELEKLASTNK